MVKKLEYKELTDREHVLLNPNMYIGSVSLEEKELFIFDGNKFVLKQVSYVSGLLKIINEIIDNSVDECVRNKFKKGTNIDVSMNNVAVRVIDDGGGVPIELYKHTGMYQAERAFTVARGGINFVEKDERSTIGMNGVGSFITNVFSKKFIVETANNNKYLKMLCSDNCSSKHTDVKNKVIKNTYTSIYFEPDVEKFGLKTIDQIYIDLTKQRLMELSIIYPQIKFKFNSKKVNIGSFNNYMKLFNDDPFTYISKNVLIGIFPSDSYAFYSNINGLSIYSGNHETLFNAQISESIKSKFKKLTNLRNADIKNTYTMVIFMCDFNGMLFDSQTKERLTNSDSDISNHIKGKETKTKWFDKFTKKLISSNILTEKIEDLNLLKEFKTQKSLLTKANKTKGIRISKYNSATKQKKYFMIVEGDSAAGGLIELFGRSLFGYYPIGGVPLATYDKSMQKIVSNKEFSDIRSILQLEYSIDNETKKVDLTYDNIVIATDMDSDGSHIQGLLLSYFYRFARHLFDEKRIYRLKTPLLILRKNNKVVKYFFDMQSFEQFEKTHSLSMYECMYIKGLGGFKAKDMKEIIGNNFEDFLDVFVLDDKTKQYFEYWMGNDTDIRKELIVNNTVDINKI